MLGVNWRDDEYDGFLNRFRSFDASAILVKP